MPDIKTPRGISWHCEVEGHGEVLFFIHGWAANSRIWEGQLKYFSSKYEVIALDLPGHGQSSWRQVSLADLAEEIEYLRQKLNLDKLNFVGSSLGGMVALKYCDNFPAHGQRLVLAGSPPRFFKSADYPYGLEISRIRKLDQQLDSDYPMILNVFFRSLFTMEERKNQQVDLSQMLRLDSFVPNQTALKHFLTFIEKEDLIDALLRISVPVHFICGTDDYLCPPMAVKYFAGKMRQGGFDFIKGCGHFPFMTKPQEFNKLLENFLNRHGYSDVA